MAIAVTTEMNEVAGRYPDVIRGSARKRITGWLIGAGVVAYLVFAWWFFSIGAVLANGRWEIAGSYLADWVSYEVRPDIDLHPNHLDVTFSRFDPLGPNGNPDWLVRETATIERTVAASGAAAAGGGASSSSGSFMGTVGGATAPTGSSPELQPQPRGPSARNRLSARPSISAAPELSTSRPTS